MRAVVFGSRPGDRDLAGRSVRALRLAGASVADLVDASWPALLGGIKAAPQPVWLVRAGAWPAGPFTPPPPSATGRPLIATGEVRSSDELEGDSRQQSLGADPLAAFISLWMDGRVVGAIEDRGDFETSIQHAATLVAARVVHYDGIDVRHDPALRVAEVVTSAQQGGAERIALDLSVRLRDHGFNSRLVTLGRPTRTSFKTPPGTIDASTLRGPDADHRARRVARLLVREGFDLVHGHLLDCDTVRALRARALPIALTLHNTNAAWPAGTRKLRPEDADLLIACAQVVEREIEEAGLKVPARTVWNGVDFDLIAADAGDEARAREWREGLGLKASDFVLLALANPRPQKRLHLLPPILQALRTEFARIAPDRAPKLVIAGSASAGSKVAAAAMRQLGRAIDECGVREHVRLTGAVDDVARCLKASDVLVSTSAHEGLSLAQLEAIAAGRPVVVTDVGGAREVARDNPAVRLVEASAPVAAFVQALASIARSSDPGGREAARRHFDTARMVEGYARLLPRVIRASGHGLEGDGLFLVANNFSTGGAQTSARRLLIGLRDDGIKVSAAVIQEQETFPTPGRAALLAEGIEVLAVPPPERLDATRSTALILDAIDRARPETVIFWNVIPEHKILLADALIGTRLLDVSPGEMYFESLDRYFANPRPGLPYRSMRDYGRRLDAVIVKYEGERERASQALGTRVVMIPNGVPREECDLPSRSGDAPLVIGTVARLDPRKRVDRLLRAVRRAHGSLPPYVLRIAGGPEPGFVEHERELRELARGLPVEFSGEVSDVRAFLRSLDLFALVAEPAGCPNASLEAMAQGLPVVATAAGGIPEQVQDGVTGLVVGREDEVALAEALLRVAHDPARRRAMGAAGRERVRGRFSMEAMVRRYAEACRGFLKKP